MFIINIIIINYKKKIRNIHYNHYNLSYNKLLTN